MPLFVRGNVSIYYEQRGRGFPLLLLPPGGMNATISFWERTALSIPSKSLPATLG